METEISAPSKRPLVLLVMGEFAVLALLVVLMMKFGLGWTGAVLIGLAAALFPILFVRSGERYAAASGNLTTAMKRYNRRMIAASVIYVAALMAAILIDDRLESGNAVRWLLALMPSAGVLLMIRAMALVLKEEDDEYLRSRLVGSALFGIGFLLVLATVWGFFETFGLVPHVDAWMALPVFALSAGIAQCARWGTK